MKVECYRCAIFASRGAAFALIAAIVASCSSNEISNNTVNNETVEQALEKAPDAAASHLEEIAALDYRDQVAWLDSVVRQQVDDEELEEILQYLEHRTPKTEVVKTVQFRGDTVDCLPWDQQLSVRNHRANGIDLDPDLKAPLSANAEKAPQQEPTPGEEQPQVGVPTLAPVEPIDCPVGTVPTRRIPVSEIASWGSLDGYIKRPPPATQLHEHIALQSVLKNYGNETLMNIWLPGVPAAADFSLTQLWTKRGSGANLETVELGLIRWGANADTRLFIFTTNNNYDPAIANSICWDDACGAFVQTDHTWELGEPIGLNSISGGTQYEQWMQLYKDDDTGHWWVRVAGTWLGYWPRSWYDTNGIANFGSTVQWGMEVYDDSGTYHGTANIGDGSFASSGFGHAAFQRRMRYTSDVVPGTYYWNEASTTGWIGVADSRCYTGFKGYTTNNDWMNYLYAGGPGYNWVANGDPNVLCRY